MEHDGSSSIWAPSAHNITAASIAASIPAAKPKGLEVKRHRGLNSVDWDMFQKICPDIVVAMMRNRFVLSKAIDATWLDANCSGMYYYIAKSICFELEDDAVLFTARFSGT